jgi:hypothetical protein
LRAIQESYPCLLSGGATDSPVQHRTLSDADCFPILEQPTVEDLEPSAHQTLSGAPIRPLARPCVTRRLRGRPLAQSIVGSPDSPVNYSRTPPSSSREWPVDQRQPGAPDTVRCTTRQSGAPKLSRVLAASAKSFSFCLFSDSST